MCNCYNINEGRDDEIAFMYEPRHWLDIHKRDKWVRMTTYDMIEFLTKSDFLEQLGYKIEEIKEKRA